MPPRNLVDDHVEWLKSRPDYRPKLEREYREVQRLEEVRIAEDLRSPCARVRTVETAGLLKRIAFRARSGHSRHLRRSSTCDHRLETAAEIVVELYCPDARSNLHYSRIISAAAVKRLGDLIGICLCR